MRHLALLLSALAIAACAQSTPPGITSNQPAPLLPLAGLRTTNTQAQSLQSAEALVPYSDLLTYAPNWPELSRQRLGQ